jgi:hypothetical protein
VAAVVNAPRVGELGSHRVGAGALKLAERAGFGHGEQVQPGVHGTSLDLGLRPRRPFRRIGREHRRSIEERRRGGEPASGLGAVGRTLKVGGDLLVRPKGGLGGVPCMTVGIERCICDGREYPVRLVPFLC